MSTLQHRIQSFAETFASAVMQALRTASLDELLAHAHGAPTHVAKKRGRPRKEHAVGRAAAPAHTKRGPRKTKGGRLRRRSDADISRLANQIVAFVAKQPKGARAETIRAGLGLDQKEWPRPLAAALAGKKLFKKGQKRATLYFTK